MIWLFDILAPLEKLTNCLLLSAVCAMYHVPRYHNSGSDVDTSLWPGRAPHNRLSLMCGRHSSRPACCPQAQNHRSFNRNRNFTNIFSLPRQLKSYVVHPRFNDTFYNNDVALFKLDRPVHYSHEVMPICLERQDFVEELLRPGQWLNLGSEYVEEMWD